MCHAVEVVKPTGDGLPLVIDQNAHAVLASGVTTYSSDSPVVALKTSLLLLQLNMLHLFADISQTCRHWKSKGRRFG
jgi:hypothetical protein